MKWGKTDGHRVEYMVLQDTLEVVSFKAITKELHREISSRYGRVCRHLIWFNGVDATVSNSLCTLRCGYSELSLDQPTRHSLDSRLRRFKRLGEDYVLHVYRL